MEYTTNRNTEKFSCSSHNFYNIAKKAQKTISLEVFRIGKLIICGQEQVIICNLKLINVLFFDEGEYPDGNGKPNKCKRSFESMLRHQN